MGIVSSWGKLLGAVMKNLAVVLVSSTILCGCGISAKLDAVANLDTVRAAYKACVARHKDDPAQCEDARLTYQTVLSDAQRTRGVLTNWPRI